MRGQHPPAPLSGFMREQRPENRGAAVCVDCESNKEKVSQRLPCVRHVPGGECVPAGDPLAKGRLASRWSCDIELGIARTAAEADASRGSRNDFSDE
jgi:hypothetical protein